MKNVATDFKEAFLLIRFFDSYITLVYQGKCFNESWSMDFVFE